jgi:EAL domain-containing protein (putative c-di-GMP-specific phosphodiesterase class I)/GGDEF domain-containing protein
LPVTPTATAQQSAPSPSGASLADLGAAQILVYARTQDFVAAVNSTLRNAGLAAHCIWVREVRDLADAFKDNAAEMLLAFVGPEAGEQSNVLQIRGQSAQEVPAILIRERIDEEIIATAMQQGARDVVTLASKPRLQAVVERELRAFRTARDLARTRASARQSHEQVRSIMSGATDAIAFVQEGILVEANPAWMQLFGHRSADTAIGHPIMDALPSQSHAAFKSALAQALQGKAGVQLRTQAIVPGQANAAFDFSMGRVEHDGEPAVRVAIALKRNEDRAVAATAAAAKPATPAAAEAPAKADTSQTAPQVDPTTGLLQRRVFLDQVQANLTRPLKAGVRQIVCIQVDKLQSIIDQVGPIAIDDFYAQFAALARDNLKSGDVVGTFGEGTIVALVERPTTRDTEAWGKGLLARVAAHVFHVVDRSVICTCSLGVGMVDLRARDASQPITDALQACREAQASAGNQLQIIDRSDADTKQQANDAIWLRVIKSALMDNRFKLMQQPIASLTGGERGMYDVLVRMVDETGSDVLPSEFMAAAERNDLMKSIDRWVLTASMGFCGSRPVQRLFVRLSKDSVRDRSLTQWLNIQLKSTRIDPARIAFQVSEQTAAEYLEDTSTLASAIRQAGFKFAIEHFGSGRESAQLLTHLTPDYLKIDGTLMQNLAVDTAMQQRVKDLVDRARARKIGTIAERVEDANTMTILWQLGVEYIQGYFVNEPEQVTLGA